MLSATFLMALGSVTNALLLVVGLYIYVSLIRQISGRRSTSPNGSTAGFGLPEAILAAGLTFLLLLGVLVSVSKPSVQFSGRVLVENLLFTLGIVLVVVAFLRLRGFDLNLLGGFSQTSFLRALSTGTILMLAAYPLIALADAITQRLLGSGSSKQSIVELFNGSRTIEQRIIIRRRGISFSLLSLWRAQALFRALFRAHGKCSALRRRAHPSAFLRAALCSGKLFHNCLRMERLHSRFDDDARAF